LWSPACARPLIPFHGPFPLFASFLEQSLPRVVLFRGLFGSSGLCPVLLAHSFLSMRFVRIASSSPPFPFLYRPVHFPRLFCRKHGFVIRVSQFSLCSFFFFPPTAVVSNRSPLTQIFFLPPCLFRCLVLPHGPFKEGHFPGFHPSNLLLLLLFCFLFTLLPVKNVTGFRGVISLSPP